MIISQTPLRISFFGGGSDLPAYYRQRGGAVLSTTIEHSVYVTVFMGFRTHFCEKLSCFVNAAYCIDYPNFIADAYLAISSDISLKGVVRIPHFDFFV